MKLVIFGTGAVYRKRKKQLSSDTQIVAFIDNNSSLWGKELDGIIVYSPDDILKIKYDKILLLSVNACEMKAQLLSIGVLEKDIWFWNKYYSAICSITKYYNLEENFSIDNNNGILIVVTECEFNGGTLEAVNTYMALQKLGYQPVLAAPDGNELFFEEMSGKGIKIIVDPTITYPKINQIEWIKKFKAVIVDTLLMVRCAVEISKIRPVLWWIHDPELSYKPVIAEFGKYCNKNAVSLIYPVMLSQIADKNFKKYFGNVSGGRLVFGIPDNKKVSNSKINSDKITFALIGYFNPVKGQDILIEAVSKLSPEVMQKSEFLLIGNVSNSSYSKKIISYAECYNNVKILGELSHEKMLEAYKNIDVCVCASREETMSIVTVEGMMNNKICIVSDSTGISEYIDNGINGYIFKSENSDELAKHISDIVLNRKSNQKVKDFARKTYEEYFSMETFMNNLNKEIDKAIVSYEEKINIKGVHNGNSYDI